MGGAADTDFCGGPEQWGCDERTNARTSSGSCCRQADVESKDNTDP